MGLQERDNLKFQGFRIPSSDAEGVFGVYEGILAECRNTIDQSPVLADIYRQSINRLTRALPNLSKEMINEIATLIAGIDPTLEDPSIVFSSTARISAKAELINRRRKAIAEIMSQDYRLSYLKIGVLAAERLNMDPIGRKVIDSDIRFLRKKGVPIPRFKKDKKICDSKLK